MGHARHWFGLRMLLRRAHELAELQSQGGRALESIEDLAQMLALWKPGAYNRDREQALFDARFAARERPAYPHPDMATVLDSTFGQTVGLVGLGNIGQAVAEARLRVPYTELDEAALREAIIGGRLAGAGLDAVEDEPNEVNPFADLPQVIVTRIWLASARRAHREPWSGQPQISAGSCAANLYSMSLQAEVGPSACRSWRSTT